MEMNVRLQVEHTVTEMLTGIDLVKCRSECRRGCPPNFSQQDINLSGSAIECRVNAHGIGTVERLHIPRVPCQIRYLPGGGVAGDALLRLPAGKADHFVPKHGEEAREK
jgi:hypothetical protein